MKKFLFVLFFCLDAFSYDLKVTASSDVVKIFDSFEYTIEVRWSSGEDVAGLDFVDKDTLSDFEIVSYKDEQKQDFKKDGAVDFSKIQTYLLHPTKIGLFTIKAPQIQIIKKDAGLGELLSGEEKKVNIIDGVNFKVILRYGVIVLLGLLLGFFLCWLIYHFIRRKKLLRKEVFEQEVAELYKAELQTRFSNDLQKKAFVVKDFLEQNKIRAKERKIELYNKTFWRFIEDGEIEKMEEEELKSYIKEIERKIRG